MAELRVKSTGTLKLFENDNTSSVTIASPASLGADRTVTLPDADVTLVSGTMSTGFAAADITGQTALGAEPADTDEFVLSDAGVLKRVDYSYIKAANTPAFAAYKSSADQSLSGGGDVKIQYNVEIFDSDSCYDNSSNYRFTPNVAGKYFFQASAYVDQNGGSGYLQIAGIKIKKNGSTVAKQRSDYRSEQIRTQTQQISVVADMNGTSDYVEAFAHAEVAAPASGQLRQETQEGSNFMGFKLIT
jgi:hypothetical protein